MDTTKGELSFFVDGVNLGVAYDGIPLDKSIMPCVALKLEDDLSTAMSLSKKFNNSQNNLLFH